MLKHRSFHKSLVRAYDLRGIIGQTLFYDDALALGCSLGTMFNEKKHNIAVVGFDARESSVLLEKELVRGLASTGFHVFRLGLCASPELYFSAYQIDATLGVMITGSHNAPEYNGFKLVVNGSTPFFGRGLKRVAAIARSGQWSFDYASTIPIKSRKAYIQILIDQLKPNKRLKIAWDPANAAFCPALAAFCKQATALDHIVINGTTDSTFPNHHPDPTKPENLKQLAQAVLLNDCDIGIAFDGDGDRIAVLDKNGYNVPIDHIMYILSDDILRKKPGATIVCDGKISNIVFERIQQLGGHSIISKTGHSFIKLKMQETNATLAGETSGHIFFADEYYGYDDALYTAVRLINILSNSESLSQLCSTIPTTEIIPDIRLKVSEDQKFAIINHIMQSLQSQGLAYSDLDGVRVNCKNGWYLIRASNTEDALTIRAEAKTKKEIEPILVQINELLKPFDLKLT